MRSPPARPITNSKALSNKTKYCVTAHTLDTQRMPSNYARNWFLWYEYKDNSEPLRNLKVYIRIFTLHFSQNLLHMYHKNTCCCNVYSIAQWMTATTRHAVAEIKQYGAQNNSDTSLQTRMTAIPQWLDQNWRQFGWNGWWASVFSWHNREHFQHLP
jgi:hypothetical protein